MTYVLPKDVKSPRGSWTLIDVLVNAGRGKHAISIGEWDGKRCLAMRWNGTEEKPVGNPQSRGLPTWFVVPDDYNSVLIETLPADKRMIVKALLNL